MKKILTLNKHKLFEAFTFIELIISITIIMIFAAVVLPSYNTYTNQQKLKGDTQKIADTLELAKKKAFSSDLYTSCANFNGYQVSITNTTTYILRFGCNGSYQDINTYELKSESNNTIVSTLGDFTFLPQGINTKISIGTIQVRNSILGQCLSITISPIGIININNTLFNC